MLNRHWSQDNPAFRHADRCPFLDKQNISLVPQQAGAIIKLSIGPVKTAWPSALKKIVAAMKNTPKLLTNAKKLLLDIKSKVTVQRNNRGMCANLPVDRLHTGNRMFIAESSGMSSAEWAGTNSIFVRHRIPEFRATTHR